jgi:hypothetical protein
MTISVKLMIILEANAEAVFEEKEDIYFHTLTEYLPTYLRPLSTKEPETMGIWWRAPAVAVAVALMGVILAVSHRELD